MGNFICVSRENYFYKKEVFCMCMNEKRKQDYKMIGLNIAYYRKLKGMTQLKLAEEVNISRTHMSNIEAPNMPTSISLDTLLDIADALDIPAANLLYFNR